MRFGLPHKPLISAVVVSYNVLYIMSGFETIIPPNSLPWSPLLRGFWFRSPETGKALISYKDALVNSPPRQLLQPPPHHSMQSLFPASFCFLLARLAVFTYTYVVVRLQQDFGGEVVEEGSVG